MNPLAIELRNGRWEDVLPDVEADFLCVDGPYGARTHAGHNAGVAHAEGYEPKRVKSSASTSRRRQLSYGHWTPEDVQRFVRHWSPRTTGWFGAFSCSDLSPVWRAEFEAAGRVAFAPVACVIKAMSVRLSGDGPSNWCVYLNLARPAGLLDGTRNGAYFADEDEHTGLPIGLPFELARLVYVVDREPGHIGGKPVELMRQVVCDYSKPGQRVVDPCAGRGSTLIAAALEHRRAAGAEMDRATYDDALRRFAAGNHGLRSPMQESLF